MRDDLSGPSIQYVILFPWYSCSEIKNPFNFCHFTFGSWRNRKRRSKDTDSETLRSFIYSEIDSDISPSFVNLHRKICNKLFQSQIELHSYISFLPIFAHISWIYEVKLHLPQIWVRQFETFATKSTVLLAINFRRLWAILIGHTIKMSVLHGICPAALQSQIKACSVFQVWVQM